MPDVGDSVTAKLLVSPFDNTTSAALLVTRPDGSTLAPTVSSSDGGNTWEAALGYTMAGTWFLKWIVTGTGASVQWEEVGVSPDPTYINPMVRVYATTTELANFLRTAPPEGALGKLVEASRKLAGVLLTAVYATDVDGYPSDPVQRKACSDAVCAIVEWELETGDSLGASGDWASASAGDVSLTRAAGVTTVVNNQRIPWKAWVSLVEAKMLPGVIYQR